MRPAPPLFVPQNNLTAVATPRHTAYNLPMKTSFVSTFKRLLAGPAWAYAAFLTLGMALLSLWMNLMEKSPDYASLFSILNVCLMLAPPFLTMGAATGFESGQRGAWAGACLAYLAVHFLTTALLAAYILPVAPSAMAFTCLLGFFVTGAALTALCLLCSALFRRAWTAALASLTALIILREASDIASAITIAWGLFGAARVLIQMTPFSLMNHFLNGLIDVKAILSAAGFFWFAASLGPLILNRARVKAYLPPITVFAAVLLAVLIQPVNLTLIDITPSRLTVASEAMESALKGLDTPVKVYQVSEIGLEDGWVQTYMKKLSERHAYIDFAVVDPLEDDQIAPLSLADNSLVVEAGETFAILNAGDLYAQTPTYTGTRFTFELEGALLTALSDATAIDMLYAGPPPGRDLGIAPLGLDEGRARFLAAAFVALPLGLALTFFLLLWRKRRHA